MRCVGDLRPSVAAVDRRRIKAGDRHRQYSASRSLCAFASALERKLPFLPRVVAVSRLTVYRASKGVLAVSKKADAILYTSRPV